MNKDKLDVTFTALCLLEHRYESESSSWAAAVDIYQEREGAASAREMIEKTAEAIERAVVILTSDKQLNLCFDDIFEIYGCFDFELVPYIADSLADLNGCSSEIVVAIVLGGFKNG